MEVKGLTANKINHPNKKDVQAKVKKILKFENPNTFKVNKSLVFLKFKRNHILEINIINGSKVIIKLGI